MKKKILAAIVATLCLSAGTQTYAKSDFINIAHRGASGHVPEHTIQSYDMAKNKFHADYIELDIHMTKDGKLVAMHDEKVDRTTNGKGFIKDKTLKEIKKLDAGSWYGQSFKGAKVPTVEEVFKRYGHSVNYYIETKSPEVYPGMEKALLKLLDKYKLTSKDDLKKGKVLIQSFSPESLKLMQQLNKNVPLILLIDDPEFVKLTEQNVKHIATYAKGVGYSYDLASLSNVKLFHKYGLDIHAYTVNKQKDIQLMKDMGIDGVFSNFPDRVNKVK